MEERHLPANMLETSMRKRYKHLILQLRRHQGTLVD